MPATWTFHSAGEIRFGPGAAEQLGPVCQRLGLRRVFLVTDQKLAEAGVLDQVRRPLAERSGQIELEVFLEGQPEPTIELAEACAAAARRFGPDGLVALGGGSNIDLSKAVATVLAHGGSVRRYLGDNAVPGPVAPLAALPTTAGTGSEVTFAAVLTDTENQVKMPILSNFIRPRVALVDPLLTLSCPPKVTADSGIDALSHAVEALTAIPQSRFPLPPGERSVYQGRNEPAACLAERAIQLVGASLLRAVREPANREAREAMSLAATLAGLAFSNSGVALVHALEAAVGGAVHCSHGEGNGILLPHVMRFNLPACRAQLARIAQLLGEPVDGLDEQQAAERAVEAAARLVREAGLPQRLSQLGVQRGQLPAFAEKAFQAKRILRVNPRAASVEQLQAILEAAF